MDREIEVKLEIAEEDYEKYISYLLKNGVNHTKKEQNDIYLEEHESEVSDLGYFIEIEVKEDSLSICEANLKLKELIDFLDLGLSKRNLEGYANMLHERSLGDLLAILYYL